MNEAGAARPHQAGEVWSSMSVIPASDAAQAEGQPGAGKPKPSAAERQARRRRVYEKAEKAIDQLADVDLAAAASLLRIGKIEVTDDPRFPTAALVRQPGGLGDNFRIVLNEKFCDRPQDEVTAIMLHELLHHIMRHLHGGPPKAENPYLANIVQDAFINFTIYLLNPALAKFFRDFYRPSASPELFLRARSKPQASADKQMYSMLYQGLLTEDDLYHYLEQKGYGKVAVLLIGSHDQQQEQEPAIPADKVHEVVQELGQQLRGTSKGDRMAAHYGRLAEEFVKARRISRDRGLEDVFRQALLDTQRRILDQVVGQQRNLPRRQVFMPERIARADLYMILAGIQPLLWRNPDVDTKQGSVNVYLDVSGSMANEVEFIYGCCVAFEEYLNTEVYLFSNKVEEISLEELRQGKISTTYGTDFDCVVEHFLEADAQKAIIFSDGYARLRPSLQQHLADSGRQLYGVVTHYGSERTLRAFCRRVFRLPDPAAR